jgi:hypothetical protein
MTTGTDSSADIATAPEDKVSSRRGMLRFAAGAAAGAVGASVLAAPHKAAAGVDGDVVLGGAGQITATLTSILSAAGFQVIGDSNGGQGPTGTNGTLVGTTTTTNTVDLQAGVLGYTSVNGAASGYGVVGRMASSNAAARGGGVYGLSDAPTAGVSPGVRARSLAGPTIMLDPVLANAPTTGTWAVGSLVADTTGRLWYCTVAGAPGTWVNLVRAIAPLTFVPLTPYRAYDSREAQPNPGTLAMGSTRTVVIKDQRAVAGGAVVTADRVPAGATAITANVTVVNTVGAGFLTANPGGNTVVSAATINWSETGQILNNGVTLAIGAAARDLTVIAGGSGGAQTDFVIDVTGYFAPQAV